MTDGWERVKEIFQAALERPEAERETFLDAAELACHFSPRAKAERNEVDYTPRRYVRKPKGSPAGLVHVDRAKTLSLRKDEARRARLLAAKQP